MKHQQACNTCMYDRSYDRR